MFAPCFPYRPLVLLLLINFHLWIDVFGLCSTSLVLPLPRHSWLSFYGVCCVCCRYPWFFPFLLHFFCVLLVLRTIASRSLVTNKQISAQAEVATVTTWSRTALLHNNRAGIKGWRGFCFCHTSKMLLSLHYSPRSQKTYFFFFVFYTPARHLSDTWLLCHLCHIWQLVVARTEHLAHNARSLLTQASDGGTQSPMW